MKNNKPAAALYDPYLDVLGGGEKHILSILQVLEEEGYDLHIFWDTNLTQEIQNRFSLHSFKSLKFIPNIFKENVSNLRKLAILKNFDIFFYVTDGSYFFSTAKKNFIFCMVPDKKLYNPHILNRIKTFNYNYTTNSHFTKGWLSKWGIRAKVIYPYISSDLIINKEENGKKDKVILSVGRFFGHLHTKNHEVLIQMFKELKQKNKLFKEFKLILAGGLKEEDRYYYERLKAIVSTDSDIVLKPNIAYKELIYLYKKSLFYIHLTGYGIDEKKHPEAVEHLGMAPLEAMATGCLTLGFNAGGLKELIQDGCNGFLFNNEEELVEEMAKVLINEKEQRKIKKNAQKFVNENFSYSDFKERVKKIIL